MRIVIVEDEIPLRNSLKKEILALNSDFVIAGEASGVLDGIKIINQVKPDIVFFDIEIIGGTSFDILDTLNEITFKTIFVTAHNHFAIKAIKYSAFDYLLKPVNPNDLRESIAKIATENQLKDDYQQKLDLLFNELKGKNNQKIGITSLDAVNYIDINDIVRIEADRSYCHIFLTNNKKITSSKSLNYYEKILPMDVFFKIHRSHLININKIEALIKTDGGYVQMSSNVSVPISRRKKEEFMKILDRKLNR